jgi:transporter family-2 protein
MLNLTLLVAVLIGAAFAMQPAINAVAGGAFGSAFPAAALSLGISLIAASLVMIALGTTPSLAAFATLPWWVVFGGLIGVLVVAGGAAIVPITGAALFFVCFIAGQLIGSLLLDHFGGFGLAVRELGLTRLTGVGLATGGVVLVRYG